MLVLNDSKTELIHFSSKYCKSTWSPELKIGDSIILPSTKVRNLGAVMDPHLEMSQHVNAVCRAFAGIRKIGQIRHYLNQDSTTRLVHAFVTTKLDACNSLIFGLQDSDIPSYSVCKTLPLVWFFVLLVAIILHLCWNRFIGCR